MRVSTLLEEFSNDVEAALKQMEKARRFSIPVSQIPEGYRKTKVQAFVVRSHWRLIRNHRD